jgi:hypothetical protein
LEQQHWGFMVSGATSVVAETETDPLTSSRCQWQRVSTKMAKVTDIAEIHGLIELEFGSVRPLEFLEIL